jgi:UPF0755 protein
VLDFADQPLGSDGPREVIVEPGDGFNSVLAKLRRAGVSEGSDLQWRVLGKLSGAAGRIQVGEYEIAPDATPARCWRRCRTARWCSASSP